MDFGDFLNAHVWVLVKYPDDETYQASIEGVDERFRSRQFVARIAYAPASFNDDDLTFLALLPLARASSLDGEAIKAHAIAQYGDLIETPTQRKARERAERRAAATPPGKDTRPLLTDYLVRYIRDWDLTRGKDEKGEPIPMPLTREVMDQFEPAIKMQIIGAIVEDYRERPNRTTLSSLYSAATTGNGPNGQASA